MTDSAKLPKIVILGTGGTIVSSGDDPLMLTGYRIKGLNVETLLCAVPELQYFARIEAHQIANIDSSSMTFSIWLELGRAIEKAAADPDTAGIVVTHGTDTMEETAWFTHLTAKTQKPIVFTGAMRPATALSADGPLNLLNAVRIAADPKAAGRGVLVALNDVILSARDAMKISPTNAAAFGPNVQGPLGLIAGAEILWLGRPERAFGSETPFSIPKLAALEIPRVDIVYSHADDDGVMVRAACAAGARAIVHAGTGNGSIHCCTDEALADAADAGVLIIRASRVTTGAVTTGLAEWQERGYVRPGRSPRRKLACLHSLSLPNTAKFSQLWPKPFQILKFSAALEFAAVLRERLIRRWFSLQPFAFNDEGEPLRAARCLQNNLAVLNGIKTRFNAGIALDGKCIAAVVIKRQFG